MGAEQRRFPRYGVRLSVRYTNAAQFVSDYVENLSEGGLFIAGAHQLALHTKTEVQIELPGQGSWTVTATAVFIIDEAAAKNLGRRAGAGMEINTKPPGFDDALLGYLLRLGRRRDHAVMIGLGVPGRNHVAEAGYRVITLESEDEIAFALVNTDAAIVAIIVPPTLYEKYRDRLDERMKSVVFAASSVEEIQDILARVDSLL